MTEQKNNQQRSKPRQDIEYKDEVLKEFKDEDTKIVLTLTKSLRFDKATGKEVVYSYMPQTSWSLGFVKADGKKTGWSKRSAPAMENGVPKFEPMPRAVVDKLMIECEVFLALFHHECADKIQDKQRERELRQANWGKQETRVTGKTERKKNKAKGMAQQST